MNDKQDKDDAISCCAIVPAYQEERAVGEVVEKARRHVAEVVVVDDCSTDRTGERARAAGATVLTQPENRGKGAALALGFAHARDHGFDVVVTLDADGQHDPDEIPRFTEAHRQTGVPILVGNRMSKVGDMPLIRRWTNRFMSWLLSRKMGQRVADTQCGYRLYKSSATEQLPTTGALGYAAESEALLHFARLGLEIGSVPISTIYGDEISKINPLVDTIRFFRMLRRQPTAAGGPGPDRRNDAAGVES